MKLKDWLAFVALSLAWGSSFLWIKIALQEIGPFMLVGFRLLIGVVAFLIYYAFVRPAWPKNTSVFKSLAVIGITNTAVPFVLISWGEVYIDSAVASILNGSVPLLTMVLAHFILEDDRLTWMRGLGLATGFAGVIMLLARDLSGGVENSALGQGAVLLAAGFYSFSAVYIRRNTVEIHPVVRAMLPLIIADGLIWIAAPLVEAPLGLPVLPLTWIALLWLGIVGSFLAYLLYYYLIHSIGPTRSTLVTYTFPLVGVVLGVVFLNELLDINLVVGGGLVVGSIWIVNRPG